MSYLKTKLPQYMIPKKFYFVKKLKLNSNGKVDRKKTFLFLIKVINNLHRFVQQRLMVQQHYLFLKFP